VATVGYQLGVDLGTTFTAVATIRDGRAEVATLGTRSLEIPSVVLLREDGELLIGEAAERRSQSEPDRFAREFKRRMGDTTPVLLGGSPFSAHGLTAHLLRGVVRVVADREGRMPDHTVVTCPANWGDYKRELLDQAVRQADIGAVSVATEPEAAAVHYASTTRVAPGEVVGVYDLGGGTFDAAVLRNTDEQFELLGDPRGIEQLGGVYFDEAVFSWVVSHMSDAFAQLDPDDPGAAAAAARLRRDCVDAKEALSWDTDTTIPVVLPNQRTEIRLTRRELENMVRPALVDTVDAMRRSIQSAGLVPADVKAILLVGGSSRIPLVGQMLVSELGRPVAIDVHPKHAVALGAAHLAATDSGNGDGATVRPFEASVSTLEPTQVTRAGRTTVTSPAGQAGAVAAGAIAGGAAVAAGAAAVGAPGSPASAPPAAVDNGTRLPRAGDGGERRPVRPPEPPPPSRRGLVALGAGAALAVLVGAVAVFALGDGGGEGGGSQEDDQPDITTAPDEVAVALPEDIPQGAPLAATTLAYTQVDGTFWNVWLIEADGSNPRALTRETEDKARLAALSPDRTAVMYTVEAAGGWELRVIDSQGRGDRVLSTDIVPDGRATWSPDGRRIAFVGDRDGPADLYILDLESGELTNLTNSPEDEGDPAWSPDGTTIAYWSLATGNLDIFTIPADGGDPVQLTEQPGDDADPAWHPLGNQLAFSSQRDGDWEIYLMNPEGGSQEQITDHPSDDQDPAWSPDGAFIAFETKRDSADRPDGDWAEVYIMLPDGREQQRVTSRDGFDAHPAWGLAPPG
jgi:actin-like ATPase involved in cell morphogenesis